MLIITGLLSSVHCVSMCGAINLLATTNKNSNSLKKTIFYNTGRIISYTIIGGIVGLLGNVISLNNTISGIIIILSSILMLLMSINMLGIIRFRTVRLFKIKSKTRNSFIIGLLNGLMPCGPLQTMQIYALSTGSMLKGALSMFLFGIGTVPLMAMVSLSFNIFKGKIKLIINKITSVLILILSLTMLNRGLTTLDIDLSKLSNNYSNYIKATLENDYQVVEIDLTSEGYENIIVQKDIPVKLIINAKRRELISCARDIVIDEYNIEVRLSEGENIIEFIPTQKGNYLYTCSMKMIKNNIKVIDNIDYFKEE